MDYDLENTGDGVATISADQQQSQAVELIIEFINERNN